MCRWLQRVVWSLPSVIFLEASRHKIGQTCVKHKFSNILLIKCEIWLGKASFCDPNVFSSYIFQFHLPFGLLYMRPLQWWRKTKGFSPRGKPTLYDQGHAAMPTCLRHVEETLGFCLKAWCWELLSSCNASDGCISHRLGSGHE